MNRLRITVKGKTYDVTAEEVTEPDPHIVAVITAAAILTCGPRTRVVSVRPSGSDWSREGRRQIFTSHKLR